jgi:hypothetical protein
VAENVVDDGLVLTPRHLVYRRFEMTQDLVKRVFLTAFDLASKESKTVFAHAPLALPLREQRSSGIVVPYDIPRGEVLYDAKRDSALFLDTWDRKTEHGHAQRVSLATPQAEKLPVQAHRLIQLSRDARYLLFTVLEGPPDRRHMNLRFPPEVLAVHDLETGQTTRLGTAGLTRLHGAQLVEGAAR